MNFSTAIVAPQSYWKEGEEFRNLMCQIETTNFQVKNGDVVLFKVNTPFDIESVEAKKCNTNYSTRFIVKFVKEKFPMLTTDFVPMCTIILDTYRRNGVIPSIKVERFDNCEQILDFTDIKQSATKKHQSVASSSKPRNPKNPNNRTPAFAVPLTPPIVETVPVSQFYIIITQKMYKEYRGEIFTAYKIDKKTDAVVASGEVLIDTPRDNEHFVYPQWKRDIMALKVDLTLCRYDETNHTVSHYDLDTENCAWKLRCNK